MHFSPISSHRRVDSDNEKKTIDKMEEIFRSNTNGLTDHRRPEVNVGR